LILLPILLAIILSISFWTAKRLQFFSAGARDLGEVRWELKELRIEDFDTLLCPRSDEFVNYAWDLTPSERWKACSNRLKLTRDWLHVIISNATLFEQVGRYCARQAADPTGEALLNHPLNEDENDLALKIMDRASMCHVMAALCLAKLELIEFCRIAWPSYTPRLAGLPVVRGHSLVAWYQHLVEDVLDLASRDKRDWMYGDILFMLTGVLELDVDEA
jgi:hypothetical protein